VHNCIEPVTRKTKSSYENMPVLTRKSRYVFYIYIYTFVFTVWFGDLRGGMITSGNGMPNAGGDGNQYVNDEYYSRHRAADNNNIVVGRLTPHNPFGGGGRFVGVLSQTMVACKSPRGDWFVFQTKIVKETNVILFMRSVNVWFVISFDVRTSGS